MYESSRELDVEKCLDAIRIARKELLRICDYTEKDIARANYVNTVLYLKPVFILRNSKPKWELMRVYLADQGVLFAYSDEQYCTRCISREIVSARCLLSRNSNERRHLYEHLPTWKETTFAGKLLIPEE